MATGSPTLFLLSGLPCSGKTTHARQLESAGAMRVSVDDAMIATHGRLGVDYPADTHLELLGPALDQARNLVREQLTAGTDVVLDHGLGLRSERDTWKQLASSVGAAWELIRFDADLATLRARCALRSLSPNSVPISDEVLQMLADTWERPNGEGETCIDSVAGWAQDFYTMTDAWWGEAESAVDGADRARAALLRELVQDPTSRTVLELGCGAATTASATSDLGFSVTGIDFSDRINRAPNDRATFVNADFTTHDFGRRFDVVAYWDGFGVGNDDDNRVLLDRIATDLVEPQGLVVIEVFDPTGFKTDDGLVETLQAAPERGYHYGLHHARTFDDTTQCAVDAWKEIEDDRVWSQHLRCYSPDDFAELVAPTRLEINHIVEASRSPWSYITVLQPC